MFAIPPLRICSLLMLVFQAFLPTYAQVSPIADANTLVSPNCIGCLIVNPEKARDASVSTSAVFDVTTLPIGLLGSISREYSFGTNLNRGEEMVLTMSFADNSLLSGLSTVASAVIFDRVKIELMNGSTIVATYGGNGLLSEVAQIDVLDPSTSTFNILITVPTSTIDQVRVTTGALASLGTGISPSDLELFDIRVTPTDRYYASRFTAASGQIGLSLLGCIQCSVSQETLVETFTADPNYEYARFRWDLGLSLLGTEYQYAEYDWGPNPILDFLGDQDGILDRLHIVLQECDIADAGLSDLGLDLWNNGGINLFITYTDGIQVLYGNTSPLLSATGLGTHSGRFLLGFDIPPTKTVERVEVRRVAPTVGLFTELRLYAIFTAPQPILLPTHFTKFKAIKIGKESELKWNIQNQQKINAFTVERSNNGIDFQELEKILVDKDINSTAISYVYKDLQPLVGDNYYRIRIEAETGDYSYSSMRVLHFEATDSYFNLYQLSGKLIIDFNDSQEKATQVILTTQDGKLIESIMIDRNTTQTSINTPSQWGRTILVTVIAGEHVIHRQLVCNY